MIPNSAPLFVGVSFFWKIQQKLAFDILAEENMYRVVKKQKRKKREIKRSYKELKTDKLREVPKATS